MVSIPYGAKHPLLHCITHQIPPECYPVSIPYGAKHPLLLDRSKIISGGSNVSIPYVAKHPLLRGRGLRLYHCPNLKRVSIPYGAKHPLLPCRDTISNFLPKLSQSPTELNTLCYRSAPILAAVEASKLSQSPTELNTLCYRSDCGW